MFVQLEELYINIDEIVTLGVYETPTNETGYEIGIVLNGSKYTVYSVNGTPDNNLKTELQNNLRQIVKSIISQKQENIVKIDIPTPVIEEQAVQQVEQEPAKEQIND